MRTREMAPTNEVEWQVRDIRCRRGGPQRLPVEHAPLGRALRYRRSAGQSPPPGCLPLVRARGWLADLGQGGLAELLLGLAAVAALHEITPNLRLHYSGRRARLMGRCALPVTATEAWGPHIVRTESRSPVRFRINAEEPPAWLDHVAPGVVEVHSALPMRHYLAMEQSLGARLSRDHTPAPLFPSGVTTIPWHVVFVISQADPAYRDYRPADFAAVASELMRTRSAPWRFTVVLPRTYRSVPGFDELPVTLVHAPDPAECVDLFAAAELVIGTDHGLTQLAGLTARADGSGPHVVGLYARRPHTKWTTGSPRHHAVATRFAQMLSLADRSPARDELDERCWGGAADLCTVPRSLVADFAARCAGWW
ncbi:hypothetical protein GCM10012275_33920 [Longimycelium tulufanense]|uniref:Uncharacterized protein n=1 Tax=Longimycelium tulufanense TaxID=907463 RepID=A0A8J3C9H5_9PSEU|nr:glycosyl transferase family 9 [Longimycelium tulufanense]GGM60012.1 hypothetical protein GCM10012275_33920 [Longimycelium tulufanense]